MKVRKIWKGKVRYFFVTVLAEMIGWTLALCLGLAGTIGNENASELYSDFHPPFSISVICFFGYGLLSCILAAEAFLLFSKLRLNPEPPIGASFITVIPVIAVMSYLGWLLVDISTLEEIKISVGGCLMHGFLTWIGVSIRSHEIIEEEKL